MRAHLSADPAFLEFYARVTEAEAARRAHQSQFAAWLLESAARARADASPAQMELFA